MAEIISSRSADEVWKNAYGVLKRKGSVTESRAGNTRELMHTLLTIEDPRQKWVFSRVPPMSISFALAELIWILNGKNEAEIINAWNPALSKYAGTGSVYYGAYGERIRNRFGFDQLERAYMGLESNPESRQFVIQIYDSRSDFPTEYGQPRGKDIPCNVCSMIKMRDDKLEWTQIMRSNDVFRGTPYNFIQYTGIQEVLAGWLGVGIGSYNHYSDSLHIYLSDEDSVDLSDSEEIVNTDSLSICKRDSDILIRELYDRMRVMVNEHLNETRLYDISHINCKHEAYNNVLIMISLYMAHRRKWNDLEKTLIDDCTNPLYKKMWGNWALSKKRQTK